MPAVGLVFRRSLFRRLARMKPDFDEAMALAACQEQPQQPQIDAAGVGSAEKRIGMRDSPRIDEAFGTLRQTRA